MDYQIELVDYIGSWECSYRNIKDILKNYKNKPVNVKISSLGGSAVEGFKIMQAFKDHGNVTAYLSGFVASAATIIALGAAKTVIEKNTLYLIHNCLTWVDTWGDMNKEEIIEAIKELEKRIDFQEKVDHMAACCYAEKCGKEIGKMKEIMTKADWLSADEVKDLGLADEIVSSEKKTQLNAKMLAKMQAANMPIPNVSVSEDDDFINMSDEKLKRFIARMAKVFNPDFKLPVVEEKNDDNSNTNFVMNKNFVAVMALLAMEGIMFADGKASVSEDEMKKINDALLSLDGVKSDKEKLEKEVADMKKKLDEQVALVAEKDKKIEEQTASLKEKDDKIAALSATPGDKSGTVHHGNSGDPAEMTEEEAAKLAEEFVSAMR